MSREGARLGGESGDPTGPPSILVVSFGNSSPNMMVDKPGCIDLADPFKSSLLGALGALGVVVSVMVSGGLRSGGATREGGRGRVGNNTVTEDDNTEQ